LAKGPKTPRAIPQLAAESARIPRALKQVTENVGSHLCPTFSFALADNAYQGDWGWHLLDAEASKRLMTFILDVSRLTWAEVRGRTGAGNTKKHRIHHDHAISNLCSTAQTLLLGQRYVELGGEVFSFHVDALERLWGFELNGVFYVVWWDPKHLVYPL
jgi:hypothetical protein